jgi:hypothetical protein
VAELLGRLGALLEQFVEVGEVDGGALTAIEAVAVDVQDLLL